MPSNPTKHKIRFCLGAFLQLHGTDREQCMLAGSKGALLLQDCNGFDGRKVSLLSTAANTKPVQNQHTLILHCVCLTVNCSLNLSAGEKWISEPLPSTFLSLLQTRLFVVQIVLFPNIFGVLSDKASEHSVTCNVFTLTAPLRAVERNYPRFTDGKLQYKTD